MHHELLKVAPEIDEIIEKSLSDRRIDADDAITILKSNGHDAQILGMAADLIRKHKVGDDVTFVLNRNINFTNICSGSCEFCGFRRNKGDSDSFFFKPEEILKKAREANALGATEVTIQGGLHPDLEIDDYASILRTLKENLDIHIHAFSPMEIYSASEKSGLGIKETLKYLKESGLDSMPGTAAEILNDDIRSKICPRKLKVKEWINVVSTAHSLDIPTTATMLYGHIEENEHQVEHLSILRDIQDKTGGFTEFVPLSFIHYNTPLFKKGLARPGATGLQDMKLFVLSRLFLDNFDNLQASWVKLGRKYAQVMLGLGANDLGGTLMEENISKSAGLSTEMISEAELKIIIGDAGRVPRKRDTLYNILK